MAEPGANGTAAHVGLLRHSVDLAEQTAPPPHLPALPPWPYAQPCASLPAAATARGYAPGRETEASSAAAGAGSHVGPPALDTAPDPAGAGHSSAAGAAATVQWSGAPESDESIGFESILGGALGPETAAAAAEFLDSAGGMNEGAASAASGAEEEDATQHVDCITTDDTGFDMRVGPRTNNRRRTQPTHKHSAVFADKGNDADWESPVQKRPAKRSSAAEVKAVVASGSKAAPAGPLPPGWRCLWRTRASDKSGKLYKTYIGPTKRKYKTYSVAKAAFQGGEGAATGGAAAARAERLFELPELVGWLRELACNLDEGAGRREAAMLAGVLRARGLQSASRKARMSDSA